jgi:hypothetical protein
VVPYDVRGGCEELEEDRSRIGLGVWSNGAYYITD